MLQAVRAPASAVAERIGQHVGTVEPIDDDSCLLDAGAYSLEHLAAYLGLLEADFTVQDPPELVEHVRRLAARYGSAVSA